MKVLHFFSNYKYTGPADPALVLAHHLKELGVDLQLALGRPPRRGMETPLDDIARDLGIPIIDDLHLRKHAHPMKLLSDVRRLRRRLARERPDVLHTHQPNDHLLAVLAAGKRGPAVVRTLYDPHPPKGFRARVTLGRSARLLVFAPSVASAVVEEYPPLADRLEVIEPAVELDRFSGTPGAHWRESWNATRDTFVVGVVARMQTHRLFPELIEGFAIAARERTDLRLVILGRGTNQETVAKQPARRSTAAEFIHFPGYIDPSEYPTVLPCFDTQIFLVPGSDGTCRAAREALVCGVPVIASRRGLLPELVEHERTGLLLEEETPEAMAAAILRMADDRALRDRLATTAGTEARHRFDARRQAEQVLEGYRYVQGARS